ncbi:hypothetical protein BV898_09740 [Hypsibius exemplaris]|uniref:Uncharacterized protein n=1 Tax=Hypsibius exemplaris TaxID=2072580 RepID=A0A1W0WLM8_HYPEX|nr:hypothetical protein BV898_09740 [Hypsibius exemplaris]
MPAIGVSIKAVMLTSLLLSMGELDGLIRQKRVVWIGVKYNPQGNKTRPIPPPTRPPGLFTQTPAADHDLDPAMWTQATAGQIHICSPQFTPEVIVQTGDGNTYVMHGDRYWRIMDFVGTVLDNRQNLGSSVIQDWPGLPQHLDAALTLTDGTTLFFKDNRFYVFWNRMPREPTTGLIEAAFPHMPSSKLDAAFMTNSSLVFVKGQEFYLFGIEQFPFVQRGNLVDMGLPDQPIESAVNLSDGLAYLISEKTVYQVDTSALQVVSTFPTQSLYGCLEPLRTKKLVVRPYGRNFHPEISDLKSWTNAMLMHSSLMHSVLSNGQNGL